MKLVDCYPELLRDIYDKIEDLVAEAGAASPTVDIAWYTTEWIREHWSGRYLIRAWWGHGEPAADPEGENLPGINIQIDQLRTVRGRELRDAVLEVLLLKASHVRPCHLATAISALVEKEWSTKKVYVPFSPAVDRTIRDLAVWQDFGGGMADIEKVVNKHGLSQSSIYDAFRRVQKARKEEQEPTLPGIY